MATIKEINHDSSQVLADFYDTVVNSSSSLSITAAAALNSSTFGVDWDSDASAADSSLTEAFAFSSDDFRLRFRIKLDNLTNNNSGVVFFRVRLARSDANFVFDIQIRGNAGDAGFNIITLVDQDGKSGNAQLGDGTDIIPSTGEVCIELRAIRETGAASNDGEAELFVNGVSIDSDLTLNNRTAFATIDRIIVIFQPDVSISGNLFYDEWLLDDDNTIATLCDSVAFTLAAMTKPADVDASGTFIYVAMLKDGTPILSKISTALDADGVTVFDPSGGSNIGVECGRSSSNIVWVAGNFDGTNVIEKSEDAGGSFSAKDDATIGDIRTFVMGPDSDDKLLVFDETNGNILETKDDGANWTIINAAVTPEVNAIARLGENIQESVFGNDGGANNSINYSVNSGDDLEDFQTGVYPNANATRVIVN